MIEIDDDSQNIDNNPEAFALSYPSHKANKRLSGLFIYQPLYKQCERVFGLVSDNYGLRTTPRGQDPTFHSDCFFYDYVNNIILIKLIIKSIINNTYKTYKYCLLYLVKYNCYDFMI